MLFALVLSWELGQGYLNYGQQPGTPGIHRVPQ